MFGEHDSSYYVLCGPLLCFSTLSAFRTQDTITLCVGDVRRLTEGEFLNDNLIDLQIKRAVLDTLRARSVPRDGLPALSAGSSAETSGKTSPPPSTIAAAGHKSSPVYAFSSMFYSKLTEVADKGQAYSLVRRWTKNVDIFSKDFLFVPINIGAHWSLTCVVRPGALLDQEDACQQVQSRLSRCC